MDLSFLFVLFISWFLCSLFFSKFYSCLFYLFTNSNLFSFSITFIFISLIYLYAYPYPSLILLIFLYTIFYPLFSILFYYIIVWIILSFPSNSYALRFFILFNNEAYLWSTLSNYPYKFSICLSLIYIYEYNCCYKVGTFI